MIGPCFWSFRAVLATDREGVGTGAGDGATGQVTGAVWVNRSTDCPEAPAQAHPLATPAPDAGAVEALARLTSDLRAVVAKVDRSWGGAAMVVRDSVAHLLGDRCTNEFCEHDHVAIRAALAPRATTEGSETDG